MSRKRRKDFRQPYTGPTDEEIKIKIRGLNPKCIAGTEAEVATLSSTIALLSDAIAHHAIDGWADIWSAIHTLTDKTSVSELVGRVSSASIFHDNPAEAARLARLLRYWRILGFYANDNDVLAAFNVLYERLDSDQQIISWCCGKTA